MGAFQSTFVFDINVQYFQMMMTLMTTLPLQNPLTVVWLVDVKLDMIIRENKQMSSYFNMVSYLCTRGQVYPSLCTVDVPHTKTWTKTCSRGSLLNLIIKCACSLNILWSHYFQTVFLWYTIVSNYFYRTKVSGQLHTVSHFPWKTIWLDLCSDSYLSTCCFYYLICWGRVCLSNLDKI